MSKTKSVPNVHRPMGNTPRRGEGPRATPKYRHTPALGTNLARAASQEPAWAKPARRMVQLIEAALASDRPDAATIGAIERAWSAWEMGRTSPEVVERVAHLVDRAYVAMHEGRRLQSDDALQGCAHILYNGLPAAVRKTTDFPKVVELVRRLERERELWPAVVKTTAELLGWTGLAITQAGHAIRFALAVGSTPMD